MAPRARSSRSRTVAAKSSQRQSSLTFNNSRVTKPAAAPSAKDKKSAAATEEKAAKLSQQAEDQPSPQDNTEDIRLKDETEEATTQIPIRTQKQQKVLNGPEVTAKKITEKQIKKYWKEKEAERKTPRGELISALILIAMTLIDLPVHQDGLSLQEKILREFDMSYQYGPCIGIARKRRWNRAENLGLSPPIEVLAVLLQEDASHTDKQYERAYMDTLANSRLVVPG